MQTHLQAEARHVFFFLGKSFQSLIFDAFSCPCLASPFHNCTHIHTHTQVDVDLIVRLLEELLKSTDNGAVLIFLPGLYYIYIYIIFVCV